MIRSALILLLALAGSALATPEPTTAWAPHPVRFPVKPSAIDTKLGWEPAGSSDTTDPVSVTEANAAILWLGPIQMVRLRVTGGDAASIRMRRVVGEPGARLWIDEAGVPVTGAIQLVEPPGPGSLWVITAREPTTIVVERAVARSPRLAWEVVRANVEAWIERGGPIPELPGDEDGALRLQLAGARAWVNAFGKLPDRVRRALAVWRWAAAEAGIALRRRGFDTYVDRTLHKPDGKVLEDELGAAYGAATPAWHVELEGPAAVIVEACAERMPSGWIDEIGTVEVQLDGVLAARRSDWTRPSTQSRDGSVLPKDPELQQLGRRVRTELAIGPGTHKLTVKLDNLRWVRLEHRARRPRLRDPDLGEQLRDAREALRTDRTAAARMADRVLAHALGVAVADPGKLDALAESVRVFAALHTAPAVLAASDARAHVLTVARLIGDRALARELAEALVFELVTRLPDDVAADPLAAIVVGWIDATPALLAAMAPHLHAGTPSDAVTSAERAWRKAPNGELTQRAMFDVGRVAVLRRLEPNLGEIGASAVSSVWLSPIISRDPTQEAVGSMIELELGKPWAVEIPPGPGGGRLALVRVLAMTSAEQPGPIRIWLDDHAFATLGVSAVEQVELAAAPGRHTMRVEAPAGSRIFVMAPGATGIKRGVIRVFHMTSATLAPRYLLPAARSPAPIRVELHTRYRGAVVPRTIEAWLHSDAGPPRRLVFEPSAVDRETWPIGGDAKLSMGASAWIWMPPLTERVWITTDEPDLLVHFSVRRGRESVVSGTGGDQQLADPIEEVVTQSEILVKSPNDAAAYLARARALIQLGENMSARRDLASASLTASGSQLQVLATLIAELETRVEMVYFPAQPQGSPLVDGAAITPMLPEGFDLAPALAVVREARTTGAIAIPESQRLEALEKITNDALRWTRARMAELAGRRAEAAMLWRPLRTWQTDVATLNAMTSQSYLDPETDASVAYGLADQLLRVDLPRLRRSRAVAVRLSRWSAITATTANAGIERIEFPPSPLDATPRVSVRRAILAAPWPDARLVDPGRETSFDVRGPRKVTIEAWCRRLWWNPAAGECKPSVRVDQRAPITVRVPFSEPTKLLEIDVDPGRHKITVAVGTEDPQALAAIHLVDPDGDDDVPRAGRVARVFLASPARSAEITVAGPTVVGIDIRGFARTAKDPLAEKVTVRMTGPTNTARALELDARPIPLASGGALSSAVREVIAVPAGVHRIAVVPDRGLLALRFSKRIAAGVDDELSSVKLPVPAPLSGGLPWPLTLEAPLWHAAEPARRFVPSVEITFGQDRAEAIDSEQITGGLRAEVAAQLRARIGRTNWFGELRGRQAGSLAPTGRVRLIGEHDGLPAGFGAHIELGAGVQGVPADTAWRIDGRLIVDRPVQITPRMYLVPDATIVAGAFGPVTPLLETDPWIAGLYRRDHPVQWIARTGLRMRPFADQVAIARLEARSNEDLAGIDMIGASVAWRGLIELVPLGGPVARLAYQPSYRFQDADRPDGYWRHDLSAELAWGFRAAPGRFSLALRGELYPPTEISGWERSLGLVLRWDAATVGEPVQFGFEEALADFMDQVSWRDER
ncbi:MAG: hypothetical protein AB7P03_07930 [Kofleriaceae bacterium]